MAIVDPTKKLAQESGTVKPTPIVQTATKETVDIGQTPQITNPITGGIETVNNPVEVNTGIYSPEQKAQKVKDLGYSLKPGKENVDYTAIQDAFFRNDDGTIGVKEDMLSPYFEKKAPEAPAPAPVTTPPQTVTTPVEPMATTEETNKKQLDAIFAENAMTPEQKDWWMKNVFNTPEEMNKFFALDDTERKKYMQSIDFAQKTTRDATLKAEYDTSFYNRQVADAKAKFAVQLAQQKANMDNDANNMSVAQGVSGRIMSQNMANAVKNQLDLNRQVYDQLKGTQDSYMQALANEHEYNMTRASNEYNDNMAKIKQDLLQKIEGLQSTGVMNTKSGLLQARKFVDAATSSANLAMQNYSYKLTVGAERVKAIADQMKEQNKYSDDVTKQMNDGYLYTAQGTRMTDNKGVALKQPQNVAGVALFKEPQKADDGTYFQAYQQADGTIKTVKLSGIEGATPADEAVDSYARLLASGKINMSDLKGMSPAARDKIISAAGAFATTSPKSEWRVIGQKMLTDENGNSHVVSDYARVDEFGNIIERASTPASMQPHPEVPLAQPANPSLLELEDRTTFKEGQRGYWCGEYVNDVLGKKVFGDSLAQKESKVNSDQPVIGGAIVIDIGGQYAQNGHVGIVTAIDDENGGYVVKSTNYSVPHGVSTDLIPFEDPRIIGFYNPDKELEKVDTSRLKEYVNYMEKGELPAGIKSGSKKGEQFKQAAETQYVSAKKSEFLRSGFDFEDPNAFISADPKVRQDVAMAIKNVKPFLASMDRLKELAEKYGTETTLSEGGIEMASEARNAQLLAKEIYNLGVLNGPDLSLMEAIIPNPTTLGSNLLVWQNFPTLIEKGKKKILDNMNNQASVVGLKYNVEDYTPQVTAGTSGSTAPTSEVMLPTGTVLDLSALK